MDCKPYMSSPEVFNIAVDTIINLELFVMSGRGTGPCYISLDRKSSDIAITTTEQDEESAILLWVVNKARSISEIKDMVSVQGEPFGGEDDFGRPDSFVEWYLKFHFAGVIKWNFNKDLLREIEEEEEERKKEEAIKDV